MKNYNTSFIYFICLVSALGGLLFGYDWVVIGGAKPFYELYFGIADDPVQQGWAMSSAILGCLVGAVTSGLLADRFGRKALLIAAAAVFLVSAYATGAVDVYSWFICARLLGGIGIGIASGLSPMYIGEVAPENERGKLVTLNQMAIVVGILGAQIVNMLIARPIPEGLSVAGMMDTWNVQEGWRWMFIAEAFPAAAFLLLTFFIPESPRWLAMTGRVERAGSIFSRIGGEAFAAASISDILGPGNTPDHAAPVEIFRRKYIKVLILGVVIAVFQQWCGTNVIFNYAQEIFTSAGFPLGDMFFNIVITGVVNVIFTFVALHTVERVGRRKLMLAGAGGLGVIYLVLGTSYYFHATGFFMVVCVVAAIACYAMTLGPITWVLLAELFPNKVRAIAMGICTFALWTGCFTLTYSFPLLNAAFGSYGTFWTYSIICFAGFIYLWQTLPETKGRSLENIERELIGK